jgi:tetratricopeptide (TPR) repeat protein
MLARRTAALTLLLSGIAGAQDRRAEAITQNNDAVRLLREGRYQEAEELYRAALSAKYDDDLMRATIANNLATLYQRLDRYGDAEREFRNALQWRQKNLLPSSMEVAYSFNNLAEIYRIEGRDWEARNLLETATRILRQFHPDAADLPVVLSNLAISRRKFHEYREAEELLRTALSSCEKRQGTASREYGVALNNLAQVLESEGQVQDAAPLYARAIVIFEHLGSDASADLATGWANIGELYQRQDRFADAHQAEQKALEVLRPPGNAPLRATILRNLGNLAASAGDAADSLPYFEQSLAIQEKTLGPDHPSMVSLLLDYASATLRAGKKKLAHKLRKRAFELLAREQNQSPDQFTVSLQDLRQPR